MNHCEFKDTLSNIKAEYRMLSIVQKFVGWVVAGCLNVCMACRQEQNCFRKWKGNFPLTLWSQLDVWFCVFHWHHSTQEWTEHKLARSISSY